MERKSDLTAAKTFLSITKETILTEFLIVANRHSKKKKASLHKSKERHTISKSGTCRNIYQKQKKEVGY